MTDQDLAVALVESMRVERFARAHYEGAVVNRDEPEKVAALTVLRHTIAQKRALEQWIASRACKAVAQC